jgi:hypothetical protein
MNSQKYEHLVAKSILLSHPAASKYPSFTLCWNEGIQEFTQGLDYGNPKHL